MGLPILHLNEAHLNGLITQCGIMICIAIGAFWKGYSVTLKLKVRGVTDSHSFLVDAQI